MEVFYGKLGDTFRARFNDIKIISVWGSGRAVDVWAVGRAINLNRREANIWTWWKG
jgi:hypothetical protein